MTLGWVPVIHAFDSSRRRCPHRGSYPNIHVEAPVIGVRVAPASDPAAARRPHIAPTSTLICSHRRCLRSTMLICSVTADSDPHHRSVLVVVAADPRAASLLPRFHAATKHVAAAYLGSRFHIVGVYDALSIPLSQSTSLPRFPTSRQYTCRSGCPLCCLLLQGPHRRSDSPRTMFPLLLSRYVARG